MPLYVREVQRKKDLKKFIFLPAKIHQRHSTWIPPIYYDERRYFNPQKNLAFRYCDTIMLLAYQDKKVVGRIVGIINHRYNDYFKEKNARFAYLECWDDQEAAHALLADVENWARQRGMEKMIGPYGFNDQDPEGFLVEGFEHEPSLVSYANFEYMIRLLEKEGYTKEIDYVSYKIDIPKDIPDFYKNIIKRINREKRFHIKEFSKLRHLKPYMQAGLGLMNECYLGLYGFALLEEKELTDLAERFLPLLDPRFIKIVTIDEEVASFLIGIPSLTEGIRKCRGHLFPFGIFTIKKAAKRSKTLELLLGAVKAKYRGLGLDVMMGVSMIESAQKAGLRHIDSHHQLETNYKARSEMERLGGHVYKCFRVFQKKL